MKLSILTLNAVCCNAKCHVFIDMLSVAMLNAFMLIVDILNVFILSINILNVFMLSVIMPNALAPEVVLLKMPFKQRITVIGWFVSTPGIGSNLTKPFFDKSFGRDLILPECHRQRIKWFWEMRCGSAERFWEKKSEKTKLQRSNLQYFFSFFFLKLFRWVTAHLQKTFNSLSLKFHQN